MESDLFVNDGLGRRRAVEFPLGTAFGLFGSLFRGFRRITLRFAPTRSK